ncbi:MAG: acylphosphatase [Acidimicrobiia bacterium]
MRGLVQGVWFRESCREQAVALGVAGWVRNRSDGSVEAVFEGPAAAVERMLTWCAEGPSRARVDSVRTSEEHPIVDVGFRVR